MKRIGMPIATMLCGIKIVVEDGNLCTTIEFSIEKILEYMTEKSKRKMFNLLKKEIGDDKNGI